MNKTTMTLTNADWSRADMVSVWADDETLTDEQIADCADSQIAYIINNLHLSLPGWSYDAGAGLFTGTTRYDSDPHALILDLMVDAADYVVEHLDEIRAGD